MLHFHLLKRVKIAIFIKNLWFLTERKFFEDISSMTAPPLTLFWHLRMTMLPLKHIFFQNHHRVAAGCGDAVRSISRLRLSSTKKYFKLKIN